MALIAVVGALVPVSATSPSAGAQAADPVAATPVCAAGFVFDSGRGVCAEAQSEPAAAVCPGSVGGAALAVSGRDCVTVPRAVELPVYSCDAGWALVVALCERQVTTPTTTYYTDWVRYQEPYRARVAPFTERVQVSYVVQVLVSYTETVRVAPSSERVQVPPYSELVTGSYETTETYCARWDVVLGHSVCAQWAERTVTVTYSEWVTAYNYETREVFNYEDQVRFRYEPETRSRWVDEPVYNYETRYRWACCRAVQVPTTTYVTTTQTALPHASCTAGYAMNPSSMCERPARTRVGTATPACPTATPAWTRTGWDCTRTVTAAVQRWDCPAGTTADSATPVPGCVPDTDGTQDGHEQPDDGTETGGSSSGRAGCSAVLASASGTLAGAWASGCPSTQFGNAQTPYWAHSYTFAVAAAATIDIDVTSHQNPYVFVLDPDGNTVGSDDNSGADGRDARIRNLPLAAGSYTIEVTTSGPRTTGSFTLAWAITGALADTVTITGLQDADATPELGAATATVSDEFAVAPADATCHAAPADATIAPTTGGARTVSLEVNEGTTVNVEVTCTTANGSDTATARFTADPAPVAISGLEDRTEPAASAASVDVSDSFTVVPPGAQCRATPTGATITPTSGATARTVTLPVAAGDAADVTVTCANGAERADHTARFTATAVGACTRRPSRWGHGTMVSTGRINADYPECVSVWRWATPTGLGYWARWHTFTLDSPGWVTITLQAAPTGSGDPDLFVALGSGHDPTTGSRLEHNDDARGYSELGLHRRDSRIADRYLPAGDYTVETTTYRTHTTGRYRLTITTDHTPRTPAHPAALNTDIGAELIQTWRYQPAAATAQITSSLPEGITASINTAHGLASLTATTTRAGTYPIEITYTNGTQTHTATTTITATCPTTHTQTPTGNCIPNTATLPAGCNIAWLHGGNYWGRNEYLHSYNDYGDGAPVGCDSLTHSGKAVYYEFSTPERLAVALGVADEYGHASSLTQSGGRPSITLWQRIGSLGAVALIATAQAAPASAPELSATIGAGNYVLEIAPSKEILQPTWSMQVKTTLPTGQQQHEEALRFGATGNVRDQLVLRLFVG
ncbi:pre-peptidase C-terminal domain-containing protein [Candidatus Poriferisodalis sp.]|uniref:pre-peptidase C-terminal domain-containing protein n=1 Tax=Candidatus Poriferisodalis sp. TaxID=3101277 RepID=UPI003B01A937